MNNYLNKTFFVLLAVCCMSTLTDNAYAFIDMPDRERVQAIAWTIEGVTVVVIMLVFWAVWRMGKRAQANKESKQKNSTD